MGFLEDDLDAGIRQERLEQNAKISTFQNMIRSEYVNARRRFPAMNSAHEGYAVILEELDEAWDEIKVNNTHAARAEMIQVAAMALAFLIEVEDEGV